MDANGQVLAEKSGESAFAAKNAIDGVCANYSHAAGLLSLGALTVTFSDGSSEALKFVKTGRMQTFKIAPREIEGGTFGTLIKADDESPFPALTQIEVYGRDLR